MPARDRYHDIVKHALEADGWTITHDPLTLKWEPKSLFVDFGAERLIAAQKGREKIAVEVKSFLGPSDVADLEAALGQFLIYRTVLEETDPNRTLYLAVDQEAFASVFEEPLGQLVLTKQHLRLIVFSIVTETIELWTNEPKTND
jgi:hypothetical protein